MKRLLDLYCGAGGASVGYHNAGYDVIGVDIAEQVNYPYEFIREDVFNLDADFLRDFDLIHASPPCQAYSFASKKHVNLGKVYPDLLGATRELLQGTGLPYVIENVVGAKMLNPLKLCGTMFNLRVIRHRLFEIHADAWVYPPCKCNHRGRVYTGDYVCVIGGGGYGFNKEYREKYKDAEQKRLERYVTVAGHGGNGSARYLDWCDAMDIHWMTKHKTLGKNKYDLTQAIPPAYSEWIGNLLHGKTT